MRVGAKAAVYVTAVLEYLTAEVLELAGVRDPLPRCGATVSKPRELTLMTCTECRQGSQGQAYHASTLAAGHPR